MVLRLLLDGAYRLWLHFASCFLEKIEKELLQPSTELNWTELNQFFSSAPLPRLAVPLWKHFISIICRSCEGIIENRIQNGWMFLFIKGCFSFNFMLRYLILIACSPLFFHMYSQSYGIDVESLILTVHTAFQIPVRCSSLHSCPISRRARLHPLNK